MNSKHNAERGGRKMTDKEYREAINTIVKNGRGFDAIADITKAQIMTLTEE